MERRLQRLSELEKISRSVMETIITNIFLIGQIPTPTSQEMNRCRRFMGRPAEFQVDECTTDGYHNPVDITRGISPQLHPTFIVDHMDTASAKEAGRYFLVKQNTINGLKKYTSSFCLWFNKPLTVA